MTRDPTHANHQCQWCDKSYARLNNLTRHENDAHHTQVVQRMRAAGLFDHFHKRKGNNA